MSRKTSLPVLVTLSWFSQTGLAQAAGDHARISPLALLLGLMATLLAVSCFFLAWRIYSYLKKGELALPWQMLGLSFFLLGLAQLLELAASSGWLPLSSLSVTFIRLLALTFLAFGLHRTTKILG